MNPRLLFRPKHPQRKEQCASCPFRKGNDEAFEAVVQKLARVEDGEELRGERLKQRAVQARTRVHMDVLTSGDFACHLTVYTPAMQIREDRNHRRQCPGATAAFVKAGER